MLALGAVLVLFKLGVPIILAILPICYFIFTKSDPLELFEIDPGTWAILDHGELIFEGKLKADTFLSTYLILLNIKEKNTNKIRRIPLLYDMLPADQFRRLKVHLLLNSKALGR